MPDGWKQPLDQPRLERPRILVPMRMQQRQLRILPRFFVELFIVLEILNVLELGILYRPSGIRWRLLEFRIIWCRLRRIILALWIRSRLRQDYLHKPSIWGRLKLDLLKFGILF